MTDDIFDDDDEIDDYEDALERERDALDWDEDWHAEVDPFGHEDIPPEPPAAEIRRMRRRHAGAIALARRHALQIGDAEDIPF